MSSILNGKKLAVIGDPIEHSLSPLIQQAMLDELGLYCTYGRILVPAGTVAAWLPGAPGMNLAGFNATMPHKTDLVPLMNTLSDDARMYHSVNTVVIRDGLFHGHNTDGAGFLSSLLNEGIRPEGKRLPCTAPEGLPAPWCSSLPRRKPSPLPCAAAPRPRPKNSPAPRPACMWSPSAARTLNGR